MADGFAPGIGAVGVDVFVLGEGQGLDYNGEKRIALPQGRGGRRGALAAIALAGLKTRHYNLRAWKAQRYGCAARGVRQWRPSAKVKEHKEERSLERLVDIEVSRKKDSIWDFWGVSRRRGTLLNENSLPERRLLCQ